MPRLILICLGLLTFNILPTQVVAQKKTKPESTEIRSFRTPKSIKKGAHRVYNRSKSSFQRTISARKVVAAKKPQQQWETKGFWSAPKNKRKAQFRYLAQKRY